MTIETCGFSQNFMVYGILLFPHKDFPLEQEWMNFIKSRHRFYRTRRCFSGIINHERAKLETWILKRKHSLSFLILCI